MSGFVGVNQVTFLTHFDRDRVIVVFPDQVGSISQIKSDRPFHLVVQLDGFFSQSDGPVILTETSCRRIRI